MTGVDLELDVLRVFADADGAHGNPLGVFVDGSAVPEDRWQSVAADLGFSETVFVTDAAHGAVRIFTPGVELAFAGHPTVGTAWLLAQLGRPVTTLRPPAGEVPTWADGPLRWVRARPDWIQPIEMDELASAAEVDAVTADPTGTGSYYPWAWIDEGEGVVRSRYLFTAAGIAEDEATGAAAVLMGHRIGRPIEIHQGRGSILHVRPGPDGTIEVGGRCVLDETRSYRLP